MLKVSLVAREPRSVARHLDAERADIGRRRRAAEGPRRGIEGEPGRQRRTVGRGRGVGQGIARVDVRERAGRKRKREGGADGGALVAGLDGEHRRVVGAVDGDGQRRRRGGAGRVAHGVVEDVGQGVGRLPQRLHGGVGLVHRVGEGAGGIEDEAAVSAGESRAERSVRRAEADRGDGLGVARIGIGVVGEDVAGRRRAAGAVGDAALLGGVGRIGDRRRRGVRRRRGNEDDVRVVVGGGKGAGREDAGGGGAAVGVDAVAAGGRAGRRRQRPVGDGGGEAVVRCDVGAGRVVGGDVGRVRQRW